MEDFLPRAQYVEFTGGEPLVNNKKEIIHFFKEYPAKKYRISTNGILLGELDAEIIPDETLFVVSLYGFDRESYRRITGGDNFSRVHKALVDLIRRGYGSRIFLKYVVYRETASGIERFCDFVRRHPSLNGAAVVSDVAAGFSVYSDMQRIQGMFPEDRIEWVYCGSLLKHMIANRGWDPWYILRWHFAGWHCRKNNQEIIG